MVNKQLKEVFIILFLIFTYSYLGYLRIIINIGFLEYLLCVNNLFTELRDNLKNHTLLLQMGSGAKKSLHRATFHVSGKTFFWAYLL